jgi:Trk-type K+ transport system membrane component
MKRRSVMESPARLVAFAFAAAIAIGTVLLWLPAATEGPGGVSLGVAAFTSTSAVTVTGMAVVDTSRTWSTFGEVIILGLVQLGGIGIMTLASLVLLGLSRRIGLRHRLLAQLETGVHTLGEMRRVLRGVVVLSVVTETIVAVVLIARLALSHGESFGSSVWHGVFHAVSAFNNAGFVLFPDNLVGFADDPVVVVVIGVAVVLGGLGVPVLAELVTDRLAWKRWSLHTKMTLVASGVLIVVGAVLIGWFEWSNPETLGPMSVSDKVMNGVFQSVSPRSAGFETVDQGAMNETSWLVTSALMFIGAAPASTGGGIKVTTFALLAYVILSEVRRDRDVTLFGRRSAPAAERQAVSIALIGIGVVAIATLILLSLGDWGLSRVLFEVTSAFGTGGLSTGITPELPSGGRILLGVLMFAGRVGPLTVGAALATRPRDTRVRYPEERPLIG